MDTDGLARNARSSRGKRMSKLLSEEVQADDEFWNQEAFKEDAEDIEYEAEDEEADVFDSDFDEEEPDEDDEDDEQRQPSKKRKSVYHEKKNKKEKKESSFFVREGLHPLKVAVTVDVSHSIVRPTETPQDHQTQFQESGEAILDIDGERSVRKSTRTAVVIKQAERDAHQAALQALSKPVKKKKGEDRKISQEEMLLEAAQTEIENVQALEIMLAREEEVKRKAIIQKTFYNGPQIRFHSRDGKNVLEFTKVQEFPEILNSSSMPTYPKNVLCVITGLPAKYRDPKTDLPYATKEAFRIIRERSNKGENRGRKDQLEESHQRKRTKVDRERLGLAGRTSITKLKYNKVISVATTDDVAAASHPAPAQGLLKPVDEAVLDSERSTKPPLHAPVDLALSSLRKNIVTSHDFSLLDMPQAFVEADDADFMLDDLEVPLPSDLEAGLIIPTSMSPSPTHHTHDSRRDVAINQLEQSKSASTCTQNQTVFPLDMLQLSDLDGLGCTGEHIVAL